MTESTGNWSSLNCPCVHGLRKWSSVPLGSRLGQAGIPNIPGWGRAGQVLNPSRRGGHTSDVNGLPSYSDRPFGIFFIIRGAAVQIIFDHTRPVLRLKRFKEECAQCIATNERLKGLNLPLWEVYSYSHCTAVSGFRGLCQS